MTQKTVSHILSLACSLFKEIESRFFSIRSKTMLVVVVWVLLEKVCDLFFETFPDSF